MTETLPTHRVVVVGGGISGLTAAWALCHPHQARTPDARRIVPQVQVLEASERLGGKIQTTPFAGLDVDTGPDAFLARVPWATELCAEIGIDREQLVAPARSKAWVWSRSRLATIPPTTVLGVPGSVAELFRSGIVSPWAAARAALDYVLPRSVGRSEFATTADLVSSRLGRAVFDRLVDPLVGGINGSSAAHLSLTAATPQLADLAAQDRSLLRSARNAVRRRQRDTSDAPVFLTPVRGMSNLVQRLTNRLVEEGVDIHAGTAVDELERSESGSWLVHTSTGRVIEADAVILASPAFNSAELLRPWAPEAARLLSSIGYASVNLLRLAYPVAALKSLKDGSGFLVPAVDGHLITACSWSSSKWSHLAGTGNVIMRVSVGRAGDSRGDEMSPVELTEAVHDELVTMMGLDRAIRPVHADVTRWPNSFPQYSPGHEARVLQIERDVAQLPGLAVAGAALHGLGIPACIRTARDSVDALLNRLAHQAKVSV